MPAEKSIGTNGNGNGTTAKFMRLTAFIAAAGGLSGVLVSLVYMMWWLFTLSSAQQYQGIKNTEFDKRIMENRTDITKQQLSVRSMERDLNEIETQFCANDIVRNLMHAEDSRKLSLLWQKTFGTPYPTDNSYYPMICNRRPDSSK